MLAKSARAAGHAAPPAATAERRPRPQGVRLGIVLAALMLTLLLDALDQNVVGTALPRIIAKLHGFDRYTWTVTAYFLATTTMLPISGKLSDQFGRKWFLLAGAGTFLVGSALCGAAQTIDQLIAFRGLQGLCAGIGIALVFTAVADVVLPAERARWQGIFGGVFGVASVVGPTLGGWLAEHGPLLGALVTDDTRWRWVFYVNLPFGLVALAALLLALPADASARSSGHRGWAAVRRIDGLGGALVAVATLCLLLGLTWGGGETPAWGSPRVLGALAAAGVLYAGFVLAERVAVEPILPLDLFRNRIFAADAALSLFLMMALFGLAFYVPLFLQGVLGVSSTMAGALMTPFSVSITVGTSLAGAAISVVKRHRAVTILGTLLMAAGLFLLTRMAPATGLAYAVAGTVVAGLGMGVLFCAVYVVAQSAMSPTQLGVGTAAVRYLGQIGGILGLAIVGTVVNLTLSTDLGHRLPASASQQLTPESLASATSTQALVNPDYRVALVQSVAAEAASRVPAGPQHDQLVAAATAQAQQLLEQVFAALKLSLAVSIHHGLVADMLFCLAALAVALFVSDAPATQDGGEQ